MPRLSFVLLFVPLFTACDPAPQAPVDASAGVDAAALDATATDAVPIDATPTDAAPLTHHAALVIRLASGLMHTQCVDLGADGQATSLEVAAASDLGAIASTQSLCKLGDTGCNYPQQACLCQCTSTCQLWGLYHLRNGAWSNQGGGPASYVVHHGDVEGWAWGTFNQGSGPVPPLVSFDSVCH